MAQYFLGIELGSTRIKAVLLNAERQIVETGDCTWKSKLEHGVWTYPMDDVQAGLQTALGNLGALPGEISAMGISGMMHGYLAFDKDWNLLAPFRTWQNTMTGEAADKLTNVFGFNIPQRWSVAHLYQAILNGEAHVRSIAHITTLAGYVHYLLTGENAVGIGEASGMFPIDSRTLTYDAAMLDKFDMLTSAYGFDWTIRRRAARRPDSRTGGRNADRGRQPLSAWPSARRHSVLPARGRRRHRHDGHERRRARAPAMSPPERPSLPWSFSKSHCRRSIPRSTWSRRPAASPSPWCTAITARTT